MRNLVIGAFFSLVIICLFVSAGAAYLLYQNDKLQEQATSLLSQNKKLAEEAAALLGLNEQLTNDTAGGFYRGMYYLCWDAYQGSGYPSDDVIEACNKHVASERDSKTHMRNAPGYAP